MIQKKQEKMIFEPAIFGFEVQYVNHMSTQAINNNYATLIFKVRHALPETSEMHDTSRF